MKGRPQSDCTRQVAPQLPDSQRVGTMLPSFRGSEFAKSEETWAGATPRVVAAPTQVRGYQRDWASAPRGITVPTNELERRHCRKKG